MSTRHCLLAWPAFVLLLSAAERPDEWKAINYAPRGHPYFRMLYDWYTVDASTGLEVRRLAATDLALLKESGFNAVHLYLWDQPTFAQFHRTGASKRLEPAGFSYPDPTVSPRRQWEALDEFATLAEQNGLWIIPHLVHTPFNEGIDRLSPAQVRKRAEEIANWAGAFVDYLAPRHRNILAWGALYALEPAPDDDPAHPNNYSLLWRKLYAAMKKKAGDVPLVTFLAFPSQGRDISKPGTRVPTGILEGYSLNTAIAKRRYASMKRHLRFELGRDAEPDLVYTYLFGPDTGAIEKSLRELTTGAGAVPADRLFIAEFAISAPFGAQSDAAQAFGENGTPTTDLEGQSLWLRQCMCALRAAGIRKAAHWTLYDAAALWSSEVWGLSRPEVSLNGHWGLAFESAARGFKPAWQTLRDFHSGAPIACQEPRAAIVDAPRGPVRFALRAGKSPVTRQIFSNAPFTILSVVSPANFKPAGWYPGSLLTLFVTGLRDVPSLWQAPSYPLPFTQFDIRVEFQGDPFQWRPAALLAAGAVGANQQFLNVQIPWELQYVTAIRVLQGNQPVELPYKFDAECCAFFRGVDGNALAVHENTGELVTPANPARSSEAITLYLTGLPWRPRRTPPTGEAIDAAAPAGDYSVALSSGKSEFRLTVNGVDMSAQQAISYLRLAPETAGVFQMLLRLPAIAAPHRMSVYYGQCQESYSKFGFSFPCIGYLKWGEVSVPVAP